MESFLDDQFEFVRLNWKQVRPMIKGNQYTLHDPKNSAIKKGLLVAHISKGKVGTPP